MPPKTPRTPTTPSKTPLKSNRLIEPKFCFICNSTYFSRDNDKHELVCSRIVSKEYSQTDTYGFVVDKQLFSTCEPLFNNKCPNECFKRGAKLMDTKILLLSPTVMKVCAFKIGDHLVAETLDSVWQSTFIAWPCVHQAPSSSFVHPDGIHLLYFTHSLINNFFFVQSLRLFL